MHERIAEIAADAVDAASIGRAIAGGFDTLLVVGDDASRTTALRRASKLARWTVVMPDDSGRPVFAAHAAPPRAPWLVDDDGALDPRRSPQVRRAPTIGDADAIALAPAWREAVARAATAGFSGFVVRDADRLPASLWSTLVAQTRAGGHAASRWIAWTAGLAPAAVERLVAAGFDTVTVSVAWWDGRAHWLADELARVPRARKLAFATDPFAADGDEGRDAAASPLAHREAVAALVADALVVPQARWSADGFAPLAPWATDDAGGSGAVRFVGGSDTPVTALARWSRVDPRASDRVSLLMLNADAHRPARIGGATITGALAGFGRFKEHDAHDGLPQQPLALDPCTVVELPPGGLRRIDAERLAPILLAVPARRSAQEAIERAIERPRLAIEAVTPVVDGGRFPVKRTAGEAVRVEADIVIDGHEKLAAAVLHRAAGERDWREAAMEPIGNDRWAASFPLAAVGRHEFTIEAWRDVFATYRNELDKKFAAGIDVSLELVEGRRLVDAAVERAKGGRRGATGREIGRDATKRLVALAKTLAQEAGGDPARTAAQVAALLASQTAADLRTADARAFATRPDTTFPIDAERTEASFAAWYELFPRSLGNAPGAPATHHGTFDDVIARLPAVRAMGFDVLYFPPIHPIGRRNRKGRNNSLVAEADDPGSPYAIGSTDGGHEALHPELGTFDDFRRLRDAAIEHGLELALDFAIQCSPDHPWLADHPGWFAWRPDGSLRYAENPPKKYEDIVNVDFYAEATDHAKLGDTVSGLWTALRDVVLLWVDQGVKIFRVDNPHTKPLPFWEWMIGEVRARHPDVIFLSEAFTRPKVMYRLAKVGFSQSYTYFTWRHTKQEFVDYLTELTGPASRESLHATPRDFFRPNFFVNTPDINPVFLQRSGRAGFLIRAALAATLSGLWGVYSGFELCEATPVPGKEDYLDSEKYQLRAWDWQRPGNIVAEITALNRIRRDNPALRTHLGIRFQNVFDPNLLYFSKSTDDRSNIVLVAINLDPYGVHEADFEVPLWQWGLNDDAGVEATDLLDGHRFRWQGKVQRMRLDPGTNPYAIWRVTL